MADDFTTAAKHLQQIATDLHGLSLRQITTRVAAKAKSLAQPAISPATLSHWGKGGKKGGYTVKARYDVLADNQAAVYPTIPPLAALLEEGSGTTWASPKRKGSKRRKKGTVGSYTRTRVPARHAWSKAARPVEAAVPRLYDEEVQRVIRKVISG
jgi:hypothetical protein